jgi:Ca2+-binding EF-hand superfamily protein
MKYGFAASLLGAALIATALPAMAQPRPDGPHHGPGRWQARIFDQADANKDGRVTEQEAVAYLDARFAEADANRDGALTPEELHQYIRAQIDANRPEGRERREPSPRAVQAMQEREATFFRIADANRDGRVTLEEIRPVALAMFRAADRNGDGVLERAELRPERGPGHRRGPAPAPTPAPQAPVTPQPG